MRLRRYVAATTFSLLDLVFGLWSASAATYYVSPAGNNNNPGTSTALPWRTIDKVNDTFLAPGSRVLFQGGQTFTGMIYLRPGESGTPTNLIRIGSYGSGAATINGGAGTGIYVYDAAAIRVENLKVVGSGRANGNRADGVVFYTDIPTPGSKLDTIQVNNVEIRGFGKSGLVLAGYAYDSTRSVAIKTGFKNVRFTNVLVHDNADAGITTWGAFDVSSTTYAHQNVYIGGCRAYHNVGIAGKGGNSGNGIVLSDVQNGLIESCVAYDNGQNNDHNGGPIGIWAWDCDRVTIQFCESYANKSRTNDGGGFDLDGGCTNCVMQNNYSHDNVGSGFLVYRFFGARPNRNNVVRNNTSLNDGRTNGGGLFVGGGVLDTLFQSNKITIGPRLSGDQASVFDAGVVRDFVRNTNTSFLGNQFVAKGGMRLVMVQDPSLQNGIYFSGNSYVTGDDPFSILWGTRTYTSLSAWRAATGQEP